MESFATSHNLLHMIPEITFTKRNKMDLNIKININNQDNFQLSYRLEEGKKLDLNISALPYQGQERDTLEEEAALGEAVGLADDSVVTPTEKSEDTDAAMEALLIEAATNASANYYSDISDGNLSDSETFEDQVVKRESSSNEKKNEVQDLDDYTQQRLDRQDLLAKSRRLKIYPDIIQNGIADTLDNMMMKIIVKRNVIKEVFNMASIICTLFYLIRKSSIFPIKSIAIAAISLASKSIQDECSNDLQSLLQESRSLASDEAIIRITLGNNLLYIKDPVNLVKKLCHENGASAQIRCIAMRNAQQKLRNQKLVQEALPIDIAKLSLSEIYNALFLSGQNCVSNINRL